MFKKYYLYKKKIYYKNIINNNIDFKSIVLLFKIIFKIKAKYFKKLRFFSLF